MRVHLKTSGFLETNITTLSIQACMTKIISFAFRSQGFSSLCLIITAGKLTARHLNTPEIHKTF